MALLVLLVLLLAMTNGSGANWCICRTDLSDASLQKTLDYACGAGADCTPLLQNGACYNPNSVKAHCSYAVNSYFQRKGQAQGTCDFTGTATVSTTDPSPSAACVFPSSASTAGTTTPSTTPNTPSTATPSTATPTTTPPSSTTVTPSTGGLNTPTNTPIFGGGTSSGISPTGLNSNTDINRGSHPMAELGLLFLAFWLSGLVLLRG